MKYFIKLINGEKLEINETVFNQYINHVKDLYILEYPKANLFICRENILFAFTLNERAENDK